MLLSYELFWLIIMLIICIGIFITLVICWYIKKCFWNKTLDEDIIQCPIDFEWKFSKADLILASRDSVNGYLNGKCFYAYIIPGLQCHLKIYPNGNNANRRGQTWIFFYVNASKQRKVFADFTLSVESANFLKRVNEMFDRHEGCGINICKTTKFFDWKNKFFIDEEITIKVKGILKTTRPVIPPRVSKIPSPISLKWKIKEDDLKEMMKPESSGGLKSKVFDIPSFFHVRYWLVMDTKKRDDQNNVSTYLYLYVAFGFEYQIETFFDFSIDSVAYNRVFEQVYRNGSGYGTRLCLTEDLFDPSKRYIVDGYLTINISGTFMGERKPYLFMNYDLVPRLAPQNPKDFLIVIDDKEIPVHKQILMDVSPVWAGMIESGMKETTENKMVIKDFPFRIIEAAIKVFYNENGLCSLTIEEIFLLHKFADKYFIDSLLELVERSLIKMISPSNVCQFIQLSAPDSYNVPKLYESCIIFLGKCFKESTPVYGAESLGEKFLALIFLRGLQPISDLVTHL